MNLLGPRPLVADSGGAAGTFVDQPPDVLLDIGAVLPIRIYRAWVAHQSVNPTTAAKYDSMVRGDLQQPSMNGTTMREVLSSV